MATWTYEDVHLCATHFTVTKIGMWDQIPPRVIDKGRAVIYYAQIYEFAYTLAEIHRVPDARKQTYVKIGTTVNLRTRFQNLDGRLLVTEPGAYYRLKQRRQQFDLLRVGAPTSTIYRVSDRLRIHIADLRTRDHWLTNSETELTDIGQGPPPP